MIVVVCNSAPPPGTGAEYCDERVGLCVDLSVCRGAENARPENDGVTDKVLDLENDRLENARQTLNGIGYRDVKMTGWKMTMKTLSKISVSGK